MDRLEINRNAYRDGVAARKVFSQSNRPGHVKAIVWDFPNLYIVHLDPKY
jgi:hypothetical protein